MMPILKAEIRKLFTVRSTYIIIAIVTALTIFFAFYVSGWRISTSKPNDLLDPNTISTAVTSAIHVVSVFAALIALLLFTHEYRYNTIMYTLTASNSRTKVLLSKILVVSVFAVIFAALFGYLSPLLTVWGVDAHHLTLVPQTIHYWNLIWRSVFYSWGYAMAGLLLAALIRNQIGAIITLFIVPGTVEALLSLILKNNTVYLPFSALNDVLGQNTFSGRISYVRAALVFSGYLLVGWAVAWILFIRRDATN